MRKASKIAVAVPAPPKVARVAKIELSDYRAFPSGANYEFDLGSEGKNLLLYGENGSGKTSLFRALRDLVALRPGPITFADFRHIFSPGEDGSVSVQLTAGLPSEFKWEYGEEHPRETAGQPYALLAERCRFLDYKVLLETNFVHRLGNPNLFHLLVKEVLIDLPVIVGGKLEQLGQVYENMIAANPGTHSGKRKLETVDEACDTFNTALRNHLPEVVAEAQNLIARMGYDGLSFDLKPNTVRYDRKERDFRDQEIELPVTFFSMPIKQPQLFLNEARLTALALAIYLGAAKLVLKSPSPGPDGTIMVRLLVLDDVLIGLDLANRLPVLKVLNEEFSDWQIVLMTYDRVWFDLAREYTEHTGKWTYLNLRELSNAAGQPGRPIVEPCHDLLTVGEKHFQSGDLMAASVYIRAAFETRVKNVCRDNGIKIAYKPDPKEVKTDKLWEGIVDRQKERQTNGLKDFLNPQLMNDIETVRSTILNRLSHSGTPTLVTTEVKFALDTIKKLQNHPFTKV